MKNNPNASGGENALEDAPSGGPALSSNPEAERVALKNKALIAVALGIISVAFGWILKIPIGAIALFMGIQAEAGLLRLEARQGRAQARAAIVLGGVGLLTFVIAFIYNLWPLVSQSQ